MTRDNREPDLEAFFEAARMHSPDLPDRVRARILTDAETVMPARVRRAPWAQLRELLGGWYGLGGVATAGLVGLWIGVAPPTDSIDPLAFFDAEMTLDFFSDSLDLMEVMDDDA